ncbi:CRE_HP_G0021010.mRNA.1.CDS.1 [Saccharomyces cerevisiae]|nr:CRE_HP_G0021010.mRNA.1.CDS.1 [Saccharomyces cerevisiae]CAI6460685.1 CRE_HP_G0021010.mRNA.1.CDS.1 [Saccharomyces cerevisiae]
MIRQSQCSQTVSSTACSASEFGSWIAVSPDALGLSGTASFVSGSRTSFHIVRSMVMRNPHSSKIALAICRTGTDAAINQMAHG